MVTVAALCRAVERVDLYLVIFERLGDQDFGILRIRFDQLLEWIEDGGSGFRS